ncbi:5-hydroxytryptamine receptor 3A [Oryzias melastigma]|uniref:5-hydroxytryptamine receptor 3A n=1 Tax=Oryzias melastigma TaxID=30732 RepID=UPI00168CF7DF|nr:5-hydroxytryptamine receptor 3A [Oryzias melastigma]
MMLAHSFLLLLLTGSGELLNEENTVNQSLAKETERVCSYSDVLNFLNLTKDSDLFTMSRPVRDHKKTTNLFLEMVIYAILDVREIDQTFISYVWIYMDWDNDYISWRPEDFCGISSVAVPTEALWKPDLTIEEMTEKDKAPPSPLLKIHNWGKVEFRNNQVIISTCKMHAYQFPFDYQSCNLTFKSVLHNDEEMIIKVDENSTHATLWSLEIIKTQFEWVFLNITIDQKVVDFYGSNQTSIIYTVNMRRRSILYCANFLVPILFLMILDLASFLIPDDGGEKLSFKVTVLLAVTVMQLLLNEILPSSTDRIPIVVLFCIGIFGLMLLSLLETIFVIYLRNKDLKTQESEANGGSDEEQNSDKTNFINSLKGKGFYSHFTNVLHRLFYI